MQDPCTIPLNEKVAHVASLSEDEFRDQLVRPLFIRKNLQHGAELCGPTEAGKDCFFREAAPFGPDRIVVVQTKKGNLNMGREPAKNVAEAAAQMRIAMESTVQDMKVKAKRLPNWGCLCVSGKISDQAKGHILEQLKNPNIFFLDIDDIVPEVDLHFPEFWLGIGAERLPYLKALESGLLNESEFITLSALIKSSEVDSPVSDNGFVSLRLTRSFLKPKNVGGIITQEPDFEEVRVEHLLKTGGSRFLITGEAGSGKSTILKRAAELLCRAAMNSKTAPIPVVLKAVNVGVSTCALAEDALRASESLAPNSIAAFTTSSLDSGGVSILIDALDEIGVKEAFAKFVHKLVEFNALYPKCSVILTSRNYSYIKVNPGLSPYLRYHVSPIGLKEAGKIIANLGKRKLLEKDKSKEVMRQLESIHGFELNPLVVTVFAASADSNRKDIPCNITELFSKFTELLLGRWDTDRGLAQQHESRLKSILLERVAYKMHSAKKTRLRTEEFSALISDELSELGYGDTKIDSLLDEIINRSTLLRDFDGFTEFRHLLIQEFFAGKALKNDDQLMAIAGDEWWKRPIVFYFGNNPDNITGLRKLCRTDITHEPGSLFNLSTTLGLSLQACYFVKAEEKSSILEWVISALAVATIDQEDNSNSKYPIHNFLFSYLAARDAVGADCTIDIHARSKRLALSGHKVEASEEFWLIVGLMEAGHLPEALERLKGLKFETGIPLLAIHLGAFMLERIKGLSKDRKDMARKIREHVEPSVTGLFRAHLKEFKSQLIEIQKGQIKELQNNDTMD